MMPLTDQVETLAWLSRAALRGPEVLRVEGELLVVNKGAHEHAFIERVRCLPGYENAVSLVDSRRASAACAYLRGTTDPSTRSWVG